MKVEDYARLAKFQTHYLKTTLDFNNPLKRQAYILLMLIKPKGYMLLDDLSEYLMVSKGTINRDIKEIKLLLKEILLMKIKLNLLFQLIKIFIF